MNGEIQQMSSVVCCARKALCDNKDIEFTPSEYVLSIKFVFSSPFTVWGTKEADSVQKWYDICRKRDLCDIRFIVPISTDQRQILGFANTSQGAIVCLWKNGKASCFTPEWDYDRNNRGWNIIYSEQCDIKIPESGIAYPNKSEEFKAVLLEIGKFAEKIGFPEFSGVFHKAYKGLCDFTKVENHRVPECIPDEFKGIYYAVETADVFGAMGSWNDSPPCSAAEMGLEEEYNTLSDRLLEQLRYNLMYVVNQSWKKN